MNDDDKKVLRGFCNAAVMGNIELVRDVLSEGIPADIDLADLGLNGPTLLVLIVGKNNPAMAQLLIDYGANPNREVRGSTPLITAAQMGSVKLIDLLIAAGADPNQRNATGESPLYVACIMDRADAAKRLVQLGADPDAKHPSGVSDRMMCASGHITFPYTPPRSSGGPLLPPEGPGRRSQLEDAFAKLPPEKLKQLFPALRLLIDDRVVKREITAERAVALKHALDDFQAATNLPDLEDRATAMKAAKRRFVELYGKPEMFGQ
jgi:ankyrin repeat protein